MGLDQYLYAERYYSDAEWRDDATRATYKEILKLVDAEDYKVDFPEGVPSATVRINVGTWRKANQVHQWFVDTVQDGVDNCRNYYVDRSQLEELRDVCKAVLSDHSLADEMLPTSTGFFFGSTEYDEWYFRDLEWTVALIDKALTMPDNWTFEYGSSW